MIDTLNRWANRLSPLKLPAMMASLCLLAVAIAIVLGVGAPAGEPFLIPSIVGFVWSLSIYAAIVTFQVIPRGVREGDGFVKRIKIRLHRLWYWIIGWVLIGTTAVSVVLVFRLARVWLQDYSAG